ncbi:MAG: phBC6A51 family helix-turn-helix protein [Bryobacteraceae bacterium]
MQSKLQNNTFRWTDKRERAAVLVAADELKDEQIAREVGITRDSLARWKRDPEFQERLREITAAFREAVLSSGIAKIENRTKARHNRWIAMLKLIVARAADPSMQQVPGGETGLLVRQVKSIGFGRDSQIVEEYVTDTGLLRALETIEIAAAQDLGQFAEKHEFSGPDGGPIPIMALDLIINAAERAELSAAIETKAEPLALNSSGKEPV